MLLHKVWMNSRSSKRWNSLMSTSMVWYRQIQIQKKLWINQLTDQLLICILNRVLTQKMKNQKSLRIARYPVNRNNKLLMTSKSHQMLLFLSYLGKLLSLSNMKARNKKTLEVLKNRLLNCIIWLKNKYKSLLKWFLIIWRPVPNKIKRYHRRKRKRWSIKFLRKSFVEKLKPKASLTKNTSISCQNFSSLKLIGIYSSSNSSGVSQASTIYLNKLSKILTKWLGKYTIHLLIR